MATENGDNPIIEENPIQTENPIVEGENQELPADLLAEIENEEIPEIEVLKAKVAKFEQMYEGIGEKELEIARNPKEYIKRTEEFRKKLDFEIPQTDEALVQEYLIQSGQVPKDRLAKFFEKNFTYNKDFIEAYDAELANEDEKALYEKAISDRDYASLQLKEKSEEAKAYFEKQKADALEALEKVTFASTTREAEETLSELKGYKYDIKVELTPESEDKKIAASYFEHTGEIPTELLEKAKEDLKVILKEAPKADHAAIINGYLTVADRARREQELVAKAYEAGIKKVETDKKLLIAEIKKLKSENQEMAKVTKGLKQPPVEMSPVIPKPIEYR